jgi:hypothetical protein
MPSAVRPTLDSLLGYCERYSISKLLVQNFMDGVPRRKWKKAVVVHSSNSDPIVCRPLHMLLPRVRRGKFLFLGTNSFIARMFES